VGAGRDRATAISMSKPSQVVIKMINLIYQKNFSIHK